MSRPIKGLAPAKGGGANLAHYMTQLEVGSSCSFTVHLVLIGVRRHLSEGPLKRSFLYTR